MEEKLLTYLMTHGSVWPVLAVLAGLYFRTWFVAPIRRYFRTKFDQHLKVLGDILEHYFAIQEKRIGSTWAVNDTLKSIDGNLSIIVKKLFVDTEKL